MVERLPIYEIETQLISAVGSTGRVLVSAPTGSGKSTQIPQMVLSLAGPGQIVVLQPRRLAARLLARRVARERKSELGHEVGYQIRFENVTSPRTRIRFVTEGILLRQMLNDPDLAGVSIILFDEFHERHLEGDIALARALELQSERRPDLKILVMSATLDTVKFEDYLRPCQTLSARAVHSRSKLNTQRGPVTWKSDPYGNRPPKPLRTLSCHQRGAMSSCLCRARSRLHKPSKQFAGVMPSAG